MAAVASVFMGVLVGVFSALFGVGGGILMVPFMVIVLGLGQHVAEGTSLLVIVPTALVGALVHAREGLVDVPAAAWLAVGGVVGAWLGAMWGLELSDDLLRNLFAALTAAVGVRMIVDGMRPSDGPTGTELR